MAAPQRAAPFQRPERRTCGQDNDHDSSTTHNYNIPVSMFTSGQLDGLCGLIAEAWIDAKELADTYPDVEHREHVVELELLAHLAHRMLAQLDRADAA
jgi:hypothetical protein